MTGRIFDATPCELGEGPLWHPEAKCLFWFDIMGCRLYRRMSEKLNHWEFDEHVSAAGWVDATRLIIASETALQVFDTATGESEFLCGLESENEVTRSNDGRADPFGGFWIGTMGKNAEAGAGAIYRYFDGQVRKLFGAITISNAISFHPDGKTACYTDTLKRKIMRVALDDEGWPEGKPSLYLDMTDAPGGPDGAVFGSDGTFWVALWGAGCVVGYAPDGTEVARFDAPAPHMTCPAFGGDELRTLFATTACQGRDAPTLTDGATFTWDTTFQGQPEHRVIL
jgi:sugar lactone lactonase YvrE